ncbi:magnesium transporter CorA family protein [Microlunatus ginsengisoli]|uniref:Magnesium transporter CorA family protein n=1 Tax=Microlunatus ginsengisoli TaxID=363863 RepID=A0ABP7A4J3_9ACTN
MTALSASRPTPLSRVWSGSRVVADDLTGEDLSDVLQLHSDAFAWWVLPRSEHASRALHEVAGQLELDEFALRDLTATDRRAKFDQLDQARIVVTNVLELDTDRAAVTDRAVSLVVTDRALICSADEFGTFRPAAALAGKQEWLAAGGVEAALQVLVAVVISNYEQVVDWLETSSDELANALFHERPLTKDEQLWAFRLRSVLSRLRRMTDPMRTVLSELADSLPDAKPSRSASSKRRAELARHWRLLEERHQRVANAADALREALSSVFDTSLALADLRLNSIMKKLTGWAAVIAVPTLVTSFVGMNVRFPLVGTLAGFWLYFVLMVISAALLYALFKRRDWI